MTRFLRVGPLLTVATLVACRGDAPREEVAVAVAANFASVQKELARRFEAEAGIHVTTSAGSTGQLFAQITNGAPFDVFLAADQDRPRVLEERGSAVGGTRFTYATGHLVLYGPRLDSVRANGGDLVRGAFTHLAIANPRTAPYGAAAEEVLSHLGVGDDVRDRVVVGESVGQTLEFVSSGSAELGFVALSQVVGQPERSYWLVPSDLHAPIRQDAVLLERAQSSSGARAFLEFLRGEEARGVMASFGYGRGDSVPSP